MDGKDFDALTRRLAGRRTRRTVVASALGGVLGAIGLAGPAAADLCKPAGMPCKKASQCCAGLTCTGGQCTNLCAGVVCTALDQCHVAGACNPATGVCSNPNAPNGTACTDGNACTEGDACQAGSCVGTPVDCSDDFDCTVDSCDSTTGQCLHQPNDAACVPPTRCQIGVCDVDSGCVFTQKDCDDHIACTSDFCDSANGECRHVPNDGACDLPHTECEVVRCDPIQGCVVEPKVCDDGNPCTISSCDETFPGGCIHTPNPTICDDGLVCTTDICVSHGDGNYHCQNQPVPSNCGTPLPTCVSYGCSDGNDCTIKLDDSLCTEGASCQKGVCTPEGCVYQNNCTPEQCTPRCDECICQQLPFSDVFACIGTCPF